MNGRPDPACGGVFHSAPNEMTVAGRDSGIYMVSSLSIVKRLGLLI